MGFLVALLPATAHPTLPTSNDLAAMRDQIIDKRLVTSSGGGTVISITVGMRIAEPVVQAFENSGFKLAAAWAAQIEYQWDVYAEISKIKNTLKVAEGMWASGSLQGLHCTTINAVFTFGNVTSAKKFAAWANNDYKKFKRDEISPEGVDAVKVYHEGVDVPPHPSYFGRFGEHSVDVINDKPNNKGDEGTHVPEKRTNHCRNYMGNYYFPYGSYFTNVCHDKSIPRNNRHGC